MPRSPATPRARAWQVWITAGVGIGLGIAWWLRHHDGWDRALALGPCVLREPPTVVRTAALSVTEMAGGASNQEPRISIAHVKVVAATSEATQVPGFDEYVVILSGAMHVDVGNADPALRPWRHKRREPAVLTASAGETLWLPRGQRYRYWFAGPCEYVAVCMPAFNPRLANVQSQ